MEDIRQRFATGRVGARERLLGKEFATARMGWLPTVAGRFVTLRDTPEHGFPTRDDALATARRYRDLCRAAAPVEASPPQVSQPIREEQ